MAQNTKWYWKVIMSTSQEVIPQYLEEVPRIEVTFYVYFNTYSVVTVDLAQNTRKLGESKKLELMVFWDVSLFIWCPQSYTYYNNCF